MLFINDFIDTLYLPHEKIFLYADDIHLLFSNKRDLSDVLQANIDFNMQLVHDWFLSNGLEINIGKCKAMEFEKRKGPNNLMVKMGGSEFQMVTKLKCLGVMIDSKLDFSDHIALLSSRISFLLRKLYNCNIYLPLKIRLLLARSLLISNITYGLEIYSGTTSKHLYSLRLIVNRIIRFVFKVKRSGHVSHLHKEILGCPLKEFISMRTLLIFYKAMRLRVPAYIVDMFSFCRSTRRTQLRTPKIVISEFERSFCIRTIRIWNVLPNELKTFSGSVKLYKRTLVNYFSS